MNWNLDEIRTAVVIFSSGTMVLAILMLCFEILHLRQRIRSIENDLRDLTADVHRLLVLRGEDRPRIGENARPIRPPLPPRPELRDDPGLPLIHGERLREDETEYRHGEQTEGGVDFRSNVERVFYTDSDKLVSDSFAQLAQALKK